MTSTSTMPYRPQSEEARSPRRIYRVSNAPGGAGGGVNVSELERLACLIGGSALGLYGLARRDLAGLGCAAFGGGLIYRGMSGHCDVYSSLGVNTAEKHSSQASVAAGSGFKVVQSMTINRSPNELYRTWRNFEGLPKFMQHLSEVKVQGDHSHWTAKAPAGMTVSWDAEIIKDEPNRMIAWRSLEGSQVSTAGSVHFTGTPGGSGTEVKVELKYDPPAGKLGSWFASLFGEEPNNQVREDLQRFKKMMEGGGPSMS